jgi:8-oxo-dGTP pyrophosphatase MutT (NUDIX family)
VTACVLVRRGPRWLLSVRGDEVGYAPGRLGLIGGHVEDDDPAEDVLEATARRELIEETGVDLTRVPLRYLASELFSAGEDDLQVTVTFVADAPPGIDPTPLSDELAEVGWWTLTEIEADPRCPSWLPGLIRRAAAS